MDQEQKEMATVGGIAFLLCCCLFVVCFSGGSKKSSTEEKHKIKDSYKVASKVETKKGSGKIRRSSGSSYSPSSGFSSWGDSSTNQSKSNKKDNNFKDKVTNEQRKKILEFEENARKQQQEWVKNNIKELIENPRTPARIKLKAKMMDNESYVSAYYAHKNRDFEKAIVGYQEVIKDKNTSAEMKYIAIENLLDCAQFTGNLELFLEMAKLKGTIIATKDLSILGVEKNDKYLKWSNEFSDYMKARQDASFKSKLIEDFAKKTFRTKDDAERVLNDRIAMYENIYKDMLRL